MIWQLTGKLWPGMRSERPSSNSGGMCDLGDDPDSISLDDLHQCDSDCPLLAEGTCPRAIRILGSRKQAGGRASLGETRLTVKNVRRQSLCSSWKEDRCLVQGLLSSSSLSPSPQRRLHPVQSLSIDNVTSASDFPCQADNSPGPLSTQSMWSASDLMAAPVHDLDTMSNLSNVSGSLEERMHELVRAFSSRTERCKKKISGSPTPSSSDSCDAVSAISAVDEQQSQPRNIRLDSFIPMGSRSSEAFSDQGGGFVGVGHCRFKVPRCCKRLRFSDTMESYSKLYVMWLFVVMLTYMYNSTVIPLRAVFPYQTQANWRYWLVADYICDFIYLVDIIVFKTRLRFTHNGIVETDFKQTKKHYVKKWMFKFDVLSMLPLDLIYIWVDQPWLRKYVWLRLPRMLKIQTFWEFYVRCDQAAKSSAHAVRIIKTMTYMLYLIHIETCGYYALSEYEGLNSNRWVYNNKGNAYIRCFYLATKTATSIGNNPKPTNVLEYMFMTLYWLSGVFVFALLIGQIRDIVEAAGQVKDNYRKKMDSALHYMQSINISTTIQDRARKWFLYNWDQSKTIDERSLVAALPKKLQTDLAINVHFNTLSKVQLFQDCERNLLYDLVLKLKPNLFLPGDYVCHKGEVGKEMYIISQGQVEVVGGQNNELVLATLSEGSVFGEISLLAMSGRGNRRTADVRCSGYTNVFTLSKTDFEEAMNEYPEAQKLLKKRAKKLLRENAKKEQQVEAEAEEIIKTPNDTPKLVKTVIQVLKPESVTAQKLSPSLKRMARRDNHHLQVPRPVPKGPKLSDHSRSNFAFDFADEKVKPRIRTESYDEHSDADNDEVDGNSKGPQQSSPQADINDNDVDALLHSDDEHDDGSMDHLHKDQKPSPHQDRTFDEEFFDNMMSELRAQEVTGSADKSGSGKEQNNTKQGRQSSLTSDSSRKTSSEERGEEETRGGVQKKEGRTWSGDTDSSQKTNRARRRTSQTSQSNEPSVEGEKTRKVSKGRERRGTGGETEGERRKPSREERKISGGGREENSGTEEAESTLISMDSQDSGLPSMKRSASQSTDKSISARDSKESFNSLDLQPSQLPLPPPPPSLLEGHVTLKGQGHAESPDHVAVGGGCREGLETQIDGEEAGDLMLHSSDEDSWPPPPDPIFLETQMGTPPPDSPSTMSPPDTPPVGSELTEDKFCRQVSGESSHPIPPQNQVTCAVEIHGQKTKTDMIAMTDQAPVTSTSAPSSSTSAPSSSTSTPSKSRPPLPYEIYHMRETIV
ncbi:uncharacterized protein LOC143300380 isoform X2 [Babylonia areolata]|uniref:uncharacterized protein LOC143300380 isoform X2 n=1 Tax=Babylonia areolata TaxID=304850 RepID=UPI003FD10D90